MGTDKAKTYDRLLNDITGCRAVAEKLEPKSPTLVHLLDMAALEIYQASVEGKRIPDQTTSQADQR